MAMITSVLAIIISSFTLAGVLPDGYFDPLSRKGPAERRGFDHTRKLLGRVDLERLRKGGCKYRGFPLVELVRGLAHRITVRSHIDKVHLESIGRQSVSILEMIRTSSDAHLNAPSVRTDRSCRMNQWPSLPSASFSVNAFTVRLPMRFL